MSQEAVIFYCFTEEFHLPYLDRSSPARLALGPDYIVGMFLEEGSFEPRKLDADVVVKSCLGIWRTCVGNPCMSVLGRGWVSSFYFLS